MDFIIETPDMLGGGGNVGSSVGCMDWEWASGLSTDTISPHLPQVRPNLYACLFSLGVVYCVFKGLRLLFFFVLPFACSCGLGPPMIPRLCSPPGQVEAVALNRKHVKSFERFTGIDFAVSS